MRNLQFTVCNKTIVHCALCIVHSFRPPRGRNGQAAVEFVAALLALLLIISGGLFLFNLNKEQRDMAVEMRAEAGMRALDGGRSDNLDYIVDWDGDGRPRLGQSAHFNFIANYGAENAAENWDRAEDLLNAYTSNHGRSQPFFELYHNPLPMSSLGFLKRSDQKSVDVDSFIRQLVIPRETVTVTHEVVLPSCSGLY